MNELTLAKATGCSKSEWFEIIRAAGKANASHKEIADFLHEAHDVSAWWAQEITVEYEKYIGRRILGQTQDGLFQLGVSKTITAAADTVLESPAIRPGNQPDHLGSGCRLTSRQYPECACLPEGAECPGWNRRNRDSRDKRQLHWRRIAQVMAEILANAPSAGE